MEEAALINVIKTLLIIALVYYGFRFISRYVLPWLFKFIIGRLTKKFNQQQQSSHRTTRGFEEKKEGDVTVKYKKGSSSRQTKKDFDEGDYVEFEEID